MADLKGQQQHYDSSAALELTFVSAPRCKANINSTTLTGRFRSATYRAVAWGRRRQMDQKGAMAGSLDALLR
jgi:hypothetical protein